MKKIVLLVGVLAVFVLSFTAATAATKDEIQASIDDGLAWLAAKQISGCGIGYWGEDYYLIGKTGLAVKKFEHDAILRGFESPFDPLYPYHDVVQWGLNYFFLNADTVRIGIQPHGDPDTDGDGYGVRWATDGRHFTYETGIALMAIVESGAPDRVVDVPGSYVDGWTYYQVAEDAMNWLAFIQNDDGGSGRGSWGYGDGSGADQSNSGYAVLGLSFAESPLPHGFELTVPQFVKDELGDAGLWIDYIQNDVSGGSGYTNPNTNVSILETGNLLAEMAWYGDDVSTPRVQNALTYIANNWHNSGYGGSGWPSGWLNSYQAMFTMMKGLEAFVIEEIGGIDWYDEVTDTIVAQQHDNGSWGPSFWDNWVGGDTVLTTCWALLTLQKVTPPIVVKLDIKPTSCPNPFNMTAKGKLPVAILGTEEFDVMMIDPATVMLEGVPIFTKKNGSLQYSYEDVATPFPGELCDCWGMGPDGYMDMVMHFDRQAIAAALGTVFDRQDVVLTLTGATYDDRAIVGADCVVILRGLPSDIACDEPGECGAYVPCNEPSSCLDPICATTADGEGVCVEGATSCGGLLDCPCPPGYVCIVNSCCGRPVCIPPEAFCYEDGGASKAIVRLDEVDGPTMGGRSTIVAGLEMSNYPNPFNPRTEISFVLPAATHVTLDIYNIVGQKVITLVNGYFEAGERSVTWDSRDAFGQELSSGVYFYRLQAGNFTLTKKMVLMK